MKTVTAKEFQSNHAKIVAAAQAGEVFQVTRHRKPIVTITPVNPVALKKPLRGSYEAFQASLSQTLQATGDLRQLGYKELRDKMMAAKHGSPSSQ